MARTIVHRGRKFQVAIDTETLADGRTISRDVVLHPGGVVILPLIDRDPVCLLRNRQPIVGEELWEIPTGNSWLRRKDQVPVRRALTRPSAL
jgi:ADP-ribose pyrophosphatase